MFHTLVNIFSHNISHNNITQKAASNDEHLQCLIKLNGICTRFNQLSGVAAKMRFYLKGGFTYHNYHKQVSTEDIDGFFLIVTENGGEFSMQGKDPKDRGNGGCGYNEELDEIWKQAFLEKRDLWLGDYVTTDTIYNTSDQLQCLGSALAGSWELNIVINNIECNLDLHLYANIPSAAEIEEENNHEIVSFRPKDYIDHAHNIPMLQHIFVLDFDFFRYEQFRVLLERLMGFVAFLKATSNHDKREHNQNHSKFPKTYRRVKQLFESDLAPLDITLQTYVDLYPQSNEFMNYTELLKDPAWKEYLKLTIKDILSRCSLFIPSD